MKKISRLLVITGFLLILLIKFVIRPYMDIPENLAPVIGFSPNLLSSIMVPFFAKWLLENYFGMQTIKQIQLTCLLGLVGHLFNEFFQLIPFFGRTFDYLDILSSIAGTAGGYLLYLRLMMKTAYKTYP